MTNRGDDEQHKEEEYTQLKDLRVSIDRGAVDGFSLCFWIYLSGFAQPPATILCQIKSDCENRVPFLVLSEDKKLTLFQLMHPYKEAPPSSSCSQMNGPSTTSVSECPVEKWIHVGCEVTSNYSCLHIDGAVVGEFASSFLSNNDLDEDKLDGIVLAGNDGGDEKLQSYIYDLQVLPKSMSIMDHFAKDPPVQLSLDVSCISDGIEECSDGVWSIVGGKASCRRNFSLEVILVDAFGRPVHKEMEIFASLVYADSGTLVEKSKDEAEAPLLTNCDGLEFPSTDRFVKLVHGRASFKLKMSQLSSKCDNRLFRVRFQTANAQRYSFTEAYSPPIRCISRNRSGRASNCLGKKLSSTEQLADGSYQQIARQSPEILDNYGGAEFQCESKCSHSPKRFKPGQDGSLLQVAGNGTFRQPSSGGFAHTFTAQDVENVKGRDFEEGFEHHHEMDDMASDSESTDAKQSTLNRTEDIRKPLSDAAVFRYCLEGTFERSKLLREVVVSASNQEMEKFAEQVSLYGGCSHHRYQILMAKQLVQEGLDLWNAISRNNHCALWMDVVPEIERKFRKIARACRGLSGQDMGVLQRIAGCGEEVNHENFDKMWCWLYPVAFTLSKEHINKMWESLSPKWIEGLITKDEAEDTLRGPGGLQKTGTFILRFPTSRSWPHPDAGSLVVTYVGADSILHNKILSLNNRNKNSGSLQDLLLEEPDLSQLGRVIR